MLALVSLSHEGQELDFYKQDKTWNTANKQSLKD
nr:MAG TPA: hypothetical protein [Caudoviricetes sp.]